MLVQRILDFINTLEKENQLISCDVTLRERLFLYFSHKVPRNNLNGDDIQFLISIYKLRWEAIIDSENDYMLNPSAVNQVWIALAKEIEPLANISYLKLLIPTLTNDNDFNDLTLLTETVNLFNFYLGYGNTTLFRKWSLCEHLKTWEFALSTYRSLTVRKLSVITVDELSRLKLCKQTTKHVMIGTEEFDNFWDFIRKKVFVHLSDHGKLSIGILPHLLELIDKYYYLRTNGADFLIFKNDVRSFFRRLYGYPLANVNFLYGSKVEYKEQEGYLLDIFIALHSANDFFALDFEIICLSKWLFRLNPALKALAKELEPVYNELDIANSLALLADCEQSVALARCCSLLVSLLTSQFQLSIFFTKQTVSLWDKTNDVFPEACGIFTVLLPLIAANHQHDLATAYRDIIEDVIAPARQNLSWYTFLTRHKSIDKWLELVHKCQLSELGAFWFEPSLLFSALIHFNSNNHYVRSCINIFLDNLIHTYTQNQNDLMKQFRVNILFTEFLNGLSEHHRRNLLILIKLCDVNIAKRQFLNYCAMHINERLSQLSQSQLDTRSLSFFTPVRKFDDAELFDFPEGVKNVKTLIVKYKSKIAHMNLDPKLSEVISDYLRRISQPILSAEQKDMLRDYDQTSEYIGQYS